MKTKNVPRSYFSSIDEDFDEMPPSKLRFKNKKNGKKSGLKLKANKGAKFKNKRFFDDMDDE